MQQLLRVERQATFTCAELIDLLQSAVCLDGISRALVSCFGSLILSHWFEHDGYVYGDASHTMGFDVKLHGVDDIRVRYYHYGAQVGATVYHFCDEKYSPAYLKQTKNARMRGTTLNEFAMYDIDKVDSNCARFSATVVETVKLETPALDYNAAMEMATTLVAAIPSDYHFTRFNCEHAARLIICGGCLSMGIDAMLARSLQAYHEDSGA